MFKHPFAGQRAAVGLRGKRADAPVEARAERANGKGAGGNRDTQMSLCSVACHNRPSHHRLSSIQSAKGRAADAMAQAAADNTRLSVFVGQHFGHRDRSAVASRPFHREGDGQGAHGVVGVDQGIGLAPDHRHEMF